MKRRIPAIAVRVLVAALVTVGAVSAEPVRELDVQGHRGCRGLMPENSMPAFRKALELGVTTLEMDVHSTADRVLVVHHDPKLNSKRCVGADGRKVPGTPLHQLTWEQIEGIDCGGAPIPRLDEVLALASEARYPVRFSIEIKVKGGSSLQVEEVAELLVGALGRHDLVQRTIVQSFSADALRAVHEIEPALVRAMLVRDRASYDRSLERSGAEILSPKFSSLRESDVRRLQEAGVQVIPWTVNRREAIRRMVDWGVDGIISDYPDRVLEVLRESEPGGSEAGG